MKVERTKKSAAGRGRKLWVAIVAALRTLGAWLRPRLLQSWRLWPVVLVCLLVSVVWHQMRTAAFFHLSRIEISPCQHIANEDLLGVLNTRLGQNIFSVDLRYVANQVAQYPWVKETVVRRNLPNTLVVEIHEREVIALLQATQSYLVDRDGTPFKKAEAGDSLNLPMLTGFSSEVFRQGGAAAEQQARKIIEAVQLMMLCQTAGGMPEESISEIRWDLLTGFSLVTTDTGTVIRFGEGNFERKLKHYHAVSRAMRDRWSQARMVDLAIDGRVVVRGMRKGTGA